MAVAHPVMESATPLAQALALDFHSALDSELASDSPEEPDSDSAKVSDSASASDSQPVPQTDSLPPYLLPQAFSECVPVRHSLTA